MNLRDLVTTARDSLTAGRVFGEPVERDGVTVVPAAVVRGGAGGGGGTDEGGSRGVGAADPPAHSRKRTATREVTAGGLALGHAAER